MRGEGGDREGERGSREKDEETKPGRTNGVGAITSAITAKSVSAHLYVNVANICWVKSGNAKAIKFPEWKSSESKCGCDKENVRRKVGLGDARSKLCPACAEDAYVL